MFGLSDPVSSLSHLVAALVFAVATVPLVRRGWGQSSRVASLLLFSAGCVFLLTVSGIYHLLDHQSGARAVFRRIDHAAIFVLIAGTFTPFHVIMFQGILRWGGLLLIWVAALTGMALKLFYFEQFPYGMGLGFYLGLGWAGLFAGGVLWRRHGFATVQWLLYGAFAYSLGAILDYVEWPTLLDGLIGPHEVFHAAVLIGLSMHWALVYQIADGHLSPVALAADQPPLPRLAPESAG